ncbi:MAG: RnfH family protein [Gammaproteobacteria bacterium]|nr:MAG: RnfH family protein [Gammaproteobacteria bacterium]
MRVEVAYALPDKQKVISLNVPAGCSAYEAVVRSGIREFFPEIDPDSAKLGIFGKAIAKPAEHVLHDGDRVEIYRPLKIDPKQARLNRAKKKA